MKLLVSGLMSLLFCVPVYGQNFAYQKPSSFTGSSYNTTIEHSHSKRQNNKVVIGSMMILVGGIVTYWGDNVYTGQRPYQTADGTLGLGAMVVGSAAIVTGIVFVVRGLTVHHPKKYGFEIVAPKSNEIGFVYNFK